MHSPYVFRQIRFDVEFSRADVTLKNPGFAHAVHCRQVMSQVVFRRKSFVANVARMRALACPGSLHGTAVRRVVVRADRWLVEESHEADLTLDARRPGLQHKILRWL